MGHTVTAEPDPSLQGAPTEVGRSLTAFVLSGGGSFGSVQVGMLRALAARGVRPDLIVGSSVGALNAAYYAGMPTADGVETLARIWRSLRRQDVFPITLRGLIGFVRRRDCIVASDGLRALVETHVPYRNLEEARIPLHVIATDLLSGEPVVLSKGPVASAVLASTAIPAAFAPVRIEDRHLADGAITCNTPVSIAAALGAQRIIALPTGYACAMETPPRGAIANALHALTLLIARQLLHELRVLDPVIEYAVVPPLCPLGGTPYDFSQTGELIDRATESTAAWLDGGGLARREIPGQMQPHSHGGRSARS